uniref:Uncharacterized protein n=1 Tax=Anguilla anguilla TaxID=7936 RepID=A0A0E9R7X0_ANGAN
MRLQMLLPKSLMYCSPQSTR